MKDSMQTERRLSDILDAAGGDVRLAGGDAATMISAVEYNSAKVTPGSLFVAVEGFQSDGHLYLGDAVRRGASAVVLSGARMGEFGELGKNGVAVLAADNTRRALSSVSAALYGHPSRNIPVIGITGTNGKTSITYMLESIFRANGMNPGVIGTVNYRWNGNEIPAPNTTPESKDLQMMLRDMVAGGVDIAIMEVSSHGLKLNRVDHIEYNMGVFTNLTRDHMDFHTTFEDYFESKRRLFSLVASTSKSLRAGIVNADDPYGRRILADGGGYPYPVISFGVDGGAGYHPDARSVNNSIDGISYVLESPLPGVLVKLNVSGKFHVSNSLCAFAAAHAMGVPVEIIQKGLGDVHTIPGRFDRVRSKLGFSVIVDYAHTDDALSKLLQSARELNPARLITIFGCGGNRDTTKRPLMGEAAASLSDFTIVTSDNPRNENPDDIIRDILAGIKGGDYVTEPDREKAIEMAVGMAAKGDIIVIAGKGHEDYQIIRGEKRHFDDRELARKYILRRERG